MTEFTVSRRAILRTAGRAATVSVALGPLVKDALMARGPAVEGAPVNALAGVDRTTILPGKTILQGMGRGRRSHPQRGLEQGVRARRRHFRRPQALVTTATFSTPAPTTED